MEPGPPSKENTIRAQSLLLALATLVVVAVVACSLRAVSFTAEPLLFVYLQISSGVLAFAVGANTLVRFRGTKDRISLVLAVGFLLSSLTVIVSSFDFFHLATFGAAAATMRAPDIWWIGRALLGILLITALLADSHLSKSLIPGFEITATLIVILGASYLLAEMRHHLPDSISIYPGAVIPRPMQLLPGALFLVGAIGYWRRLRQTQSKFDRGLFWAALVNAGSQFAASQSDRLLDAAFTFAEALGAIGYGIALVGALLDEVDLFDQNEQLAMSDPLTGLFNYRKMQEVLQTEIRRTIRTGRTFTLMLLDLDGLKKINDVYGHLTGTRALCRLADILRSQTRSIDTAARYGGDEFVLILPETGESEAVQIAERIHNQFAASQELPRISASIGIAYFPKDGANAEDILSAADKSLYMAKGHSHTARKHEILTMKLRKE